MSNPIFLLLNNCIIILLNLYCHLHIYIYDGKIALVDLLNNNIPIYICCWDIEFIHQSGYVKIFVMRIWFIKQFSNIDKSLQLLSEYVSNANCLDATPRTRYASNLYLKHHYKLFVCIYNMYYLLIKSMLTGVRIR